MRKGPVQDLQRLLFNTKSGTIFRPEYLIGAAIAAFGGGFTACAGIATWFWAHR